MQEITKRFIFWNQFLEQFEGFSSEFAELELLENVNKYLMDTTKNRDEFLEYIEFFFGMGKKELSKIHKLYEKELKRLSFFICSP